MRPPGPAALGKVIFGAALLALSALALLRTPPAPACPPAPPAPLPPPPPPAPAPPAQPDTPPLGINLIGYLAGEFGIAVATRALLRALAASGLPVFACDAHAWAGAPYARSRTVLEEVLAEAERGGNPVREGNCSAVAGQGAFLNVWAIPPGLAAIAARKLRSTGHDVLKGRINAVWWFWEAEGFPLDDVSRFRIADEIWGPTDYISGLFATYSQLPVRTVRAPLPNDLVAPPDPDAVAAARAGFNLTDRDLAFLFSFDCGSVTLRKNPAGAVSAFCAAFPDPDEEFPGGRKPLLLLKSTHCAELADPEWKALQPLVAGRPRIRPMPGHFPEADVRALFLAADAYLSLHRSEGLGLGMLQASARGRPVVGTAYGGNADFMREDTAYLVPYRKVPVGQQRGPYRPEFLWAEPDGKKAAEHLRRIASDPEGARERGRRAREFVLRELSLATTGGVVRRRVEALWEARGEVLRWRERRQAPKGG
ncbi:hypothetical protein DFJ74DRAFT_707608 [Hyaloraphidium curvatum]|nr:hypothetical protein DFJ74DRAFT_707608 [Hyaloraphidium curvatum]